MSDDSSNDAVMRCALVVIGAGIAGLNAAYVASRYLGKNDRIILVDRKSSAGGMWTNTYDYVRLHQPHPMFTTGDVEWTLGKPAQHLATKSEILDHFQHCLKQVRDKVSLTELYGWECAQCEETKEGDGWQARVRLTSSTGSGETRTIIARHCIKAAGFRIEPSEPLTFDSQAVRSFSPHDVYGPDSAINDSRRPIYIVGGGKTAMDTAHMLMKSMPDSPTHLIVGRGTMFARRDKIFPTGLRRWIGGRTTLQQALDIVDRFDGSNVPEVRDFFRRNYAYSLGDDFEYYALGFLSKTEHRFIQAQAASITRDYLDAIVDSPAGPVMRFRNGGEQAIETGSRIVNCSGYVMRKLYDSEPYVSENGVIVSVQPTSSIHVLTTFGAYFLTHLLYLGRLRDLPLYALDHQALINADKATFPYATMAHILLNISLILEAVPVSVMRECGLDFDRWHPWYRRMAGYLRITRRRGEYNDKCRQALDTVAARYGISCGPLPHVAAAAGTRTSAA